VQIEGNFVVLSGWLWESSTGPAQVPQLTETDVFDVVAYEGVTAPPAA